MNFSAQMQLFDLKSFMAICHTSAAPRKETTLHEYRQNYFCSAQGAEGTLLLKLRGCTIEAGEIFSGLFNY